MEKEVKHKFYSLAKYPNLEILMDSQLASAGANQAKLLEKYKKNKNAIKRQLLALKVAYGFIFIFIPFFSVWGYLEIVEGFSSSAPIETLVFTNSFVFGIFFLMSILYVLLLGLFSTSSFMSGNAFKWLQTLPFSKKNLKKLGYVTVFRNLDIALIALTFGFPTILLIMTQNFWLFITCLVSSALNAIFAFSILIILSEKMAKIFSETSGTSKKANILRIVTMGGFFIIAFGTSFLLSWSLNLIEEIFILFPTNESIRMLNRILSYIPFPFGISYLIAFMATPGSVPPDLIITSVIGFILFIGLVILLYNVALKHLRRVTATEIELDEKSKRKVIPKKEILIEIKTISTVKSFIRKDLISTTRDYQSFIFLIMPIVYPIIIILSISPAFVQGVIPIEGIIILWSTVLGVNQFIPFMLVAGFLNMEESGASILSSLPLLSRKQAKGKIYLMLTIQAIGLGLLGIILMIMTQSLLLLFLFLFTIPITWIFLFFIFELKIRLFGKMKYKYVVEEVNKQRKVLKWVLLIVSELLVYFVIVIIEFMLLTFYGILGIIIGLVVISIIGLSSLLYIFTKMFPKEKALATYNTGGLLKRIPILGIFIITLLYIGFMFLASFAEILFIPILITMTYTQILIFDFFFQFGFLALLWLVVIPYGLKLPKKYDSFKQYTENIHLSTVKPVMGKIFIGISSFIIFGIVVFVGANLLGDYTFNPTILFGDPNPYLPGLAGFGWFLFIYMLIPGIWEEITWRGVAIPMLLNKYSTRSSIIISSIMFGFAHSFNLIIYLILGADPLPILIAVLFQVTYASFMGVAFGYMYIKTRSLLPSIILHYLIDSVGLLLFTTYIKDIFLEAIFAICFVGIIPAILIVIMVRFAVKQEKNPLIT